jgi:RNA polymerase sigma factor (sigma-70 family)
MEHETAQQLEALHTDSFGWAVHCCGGNPSRAEDVLQIAYLKVVARRVVFSGGSSFKTWWFGVIRLTALEEHRRLRYRESLLGRLLAQVTGHPQASPPCPARQMEASERVQELKQALACLPARQAEVLHLVFYQDLTVNEAAAVMKISPGSARQHYERGKARLRTLLQPPLPAN